MEKYRKIHISLFITIVATLGLTYLYGTYFCNSAKCFNTLGAPLLDPLLYFSLGLGTYVGLLLFLPRIIFKNWLVWVASWYLPVSIFFISQTKPFAGGILQIDRELATIYWISGLGILTILFVIGNFFVSHFKKK